MMIVEVSGSAVRRGLRLLFAVGFGVVAAVLVAGPASAAPLNHRPDRVHVVHVSGHKNAAKHGHGPTSHHPPKAAKHAGKAQKPAARHAAKAAKHAARHAAKAAAKAAKRTAKSTARVTRRNVHRPAPRPTRNATGRARHRQQAAGAATIDDRSITAQGGVRAAVHHGNDLEPTVRPEHRSSSLPVASAGPGSSSGDLPSRAVGPLQRLGRGISHVPGFSVFGGPVGWVLSGVLLVALLMIVSALALGRRRTAVGSS